MIESSEIRKVLRVEMRIDKLIQLKEEFHNMSMTSNTLNSYPVIQDFYKDLVDVLSRVE